MKKLSEREISKNFIQKNLYDEIKHEKKNNLLLKEVGFSIGGIGFGNKNNGFSMSPKMTIQSWSDIDDESEFDKSSEDSFYDESVESLGDENHSVYGFNAGDHFDTSHMFNSESDYYENGEQGAAEKPPKLDSKGNISPKELHKHFDLDGDGDVDMYEYTEHIDFHAKHPDLLSQWRNVKKTNRGSCKDYDSYCMVGDSIMDNYDDLTNFIDDIMCKSGSTCTDSTVKALNDVIKILKKSGII
jgi:hypothetical protein